MLQLDINYFLIRNFVFFFFLFHISLWIGSALNLLKYLTASDWKAELVDEFKKDYFLNLEAALAKEYAAGKQIFPPKNLIFNAMNNTPLNKVSCLKLFHTLRDFL